MQIINLSERINNRENRACGLLSDITAFSMIHTFCAYKAKHGKEVDVPDNTKVEVEFKINGQEMDFVELMERFSEGRDEYIKKEACKLLQEKFNDSINKLQITVDDATRELRKNLGLPEYEDD